MSDDQDFAIDAEAAKPAEDSDASPPAPPMVLIEYRRGLSTALVPPVLILLAAMIILSYQRQTPIRSLAPPLLAPAAKTPAGQGRIIMVEGAGTGAAIEPIDARTERRFGPPTPAVSSTPAPAPRVAEASGPVGELDATKETPAGSGRNDRNDPMPPAIARAEPVVPLPTKEQFDEELRRESERKGAEMKEMEVRRKTAWWREVQEAYQRAQDERIPFQKDLDFRVKKLGMQAGPEINNLCERYGRITSPVIHDAVLLALKRNIRMTRELKVEMMRRLGLPEPLILDYLAHELDKTTKKTRGGPRDSNEVRVLAARLLLAIPISPPPPSASAPAPASRAAPLSGARTSGKAVAGAAPVPGPGSVRRPQ